MDSQAFLQFGPPRPIVEARLRSSSSPSSGGLSRNVPSPLPHPRSYPSSPHTVGLHCSVASQSYPVFPAHAQLTPTRSATTTKVREAVLHTKNPLAANMVLPVQSRPKMHLYAADKKPVQSAPKAEDFPAVPVEWLVGRSPSSSQTSSVSLSDLQSGDSSEDESESLSSASTDRVSSSPLSSVPSTPSIGDHDGSACHFLSVGLKALLKVQA